MDAFSRHDEVSPNDVAIVGMALRVPGATSIDEFWANLRGGIESVRNLTVEEIATARELGDPVDQKNYVRRTSALSGMEMFDADFFGLSPKEAAIMDPQHRQFLECAWEAMEDAGRTPDSSAGPVGVFAGCGMGSYFYFNVCSNRQLVDQVGMFLLRHTGNDKDFLSTRVSYSLDLKGPSVNVQTACSTSLVAAHYACQSLLSGECDMALAGGVTIEFPHRRGYAFQYGEILSPDGHCRPFDKRAAGTVFGSGVGVVVLRRLADAIADGDNIHAVIKGSAVNNDGSGKAGYLAPSVTGQAEAVVEALGLAGVDADTIGYIECHGTGTKLGDPIEIEALTQAFRQGTDRTSFCGVGSVKSNIGHLDTAAGVISLIKVALALKHNEMPPSLGFDAPNPAIDFGRSPFFVNDRLQSWPETGDRRRAAVNSLGVGGTNAHMIVEQAPPVPRRSETTAAGPHLLILAGKNAKAADAAMVRLGEALRGDPMLSLEDVAHTLMAGRRHFPVRRVAAIADRDDAIAVLTGNDRRRIHGHDLVERPCEPVFLFPGGGAQYPRMADELYEQDGDFKRTVDEGLSYLPAQMAERVRDVWLGAVSLTPDAAQSFLQPSLQLPAILICEIAIARLWIRHGIRPAALIGHSMGENAAACLSGVLSFKDAVRLVHLRGELFETVERSGMMSVSADRAAVAALLPPELDIASVNAPELCVVSGRNEHLEVFRETLLEKGIDAARVPIDIAAHSRLVDGVLGQFETFLKGIDLHAPSIPIVSNRDGRPLSDQDARDPAYWTRHLRSTVEFARGMEWLSETDDRVFIEVGPGRTLSSLAKAQPRLDGNRVINSLPHPDDRSPARLHFIGALGRAWAVGLQPKIDEWTGKAGRRVSLPTYPFQHKRYFIEPAAPDAKTTESVSALQKLPDIADWGWKRVWKRSVADCTPDMQPDAACWLIFLDESGRGLSLATRLRALGRRVATVALGDAFAARPDDTYVLCPEDGLAGYEALFSALRASDCVPDHIVHLWLLTEKETFRAGSSLFMRNQECGFWSLLHLAQAMGEGAGDGSVQFTIATSGMQRVDKEPVRHPEKATVLGPALVIGREMDRATVRLVDFEIDATPPARASLFVRRRREPAADMLDAQLWEEISAVSGNEITARRGEQRWTRHHARLPLPALGGEHAAIRRNGVYLFTGGHGDLALAIAKPLVREFGARIVLIGRSHIPDRSEWKVLSATLPRGDRLRQVVETIGELEAQGGEILHLAADVTDQVAMAEAFEAARDRFGRIDGVFHTAGVIDDGLMQGRNQAQSEAVLAPKLYGTTIVGDLAREAGVDFLLLFSSTSTDTAPAGQADYVAANEFLNSYAQSGVHQDGPRTLALHWGVWNEVGMAARAVHDTASIADDRSIETEILGSTFDRMIEDEAGRTWLETTIGVKSHWVLNEHRLASGQAVYPGTGYLDLLARAAASIGLPAAGQFSDLVFLRPLAVGDDERCRLRVSFERKNGVYRAVIASAGEVGGEPVEHVHAVFRPDAAHVSERIDLDALAGRFPSSRNAVEGAALPSIQEAHLRFGPRWRVLQSLRFGRAEAMAEIALADEFMADLSAGGLHPALLDIATGFAMELIPGYDPAEGLWVPATYGALTIHRSLPADIVSWVRLADSAEFGDGYAAFDVTITDIDGEVLVDIERFLVKKLAKDDVFSNAVANVSPAPQPLRSRPAGLAKLAQNVRNGILPHEGFEALQRALASGEVEPIVSSIDLQKLRIAAAQAPGETSEKGSTFERPDLDSEYTQPRNDIEVTLAGFWSELLGIEKIGIHDSFFDVGGHSLIAVRLFRMIRNAFGIDLPIATLFDAPTIAACAEIIAARSTSVVAGAATEAANAADAPQGFVHLVALHPGPSGDATPVFICAGMFGNVLNLRRLAIHLGRDRPVYALQARGLFGAAPPHETFEEMAADYLAELRQVQPQGPYLLAGFSGGGLTAFEMAHQLQSAGEEVARLVMLDTPLPSQRPLSRRDKVSMKVQDFRRDGASAVVKWAENKARWNAELRNRANAADAEGETFHNIAIEAAFRRALTRYTVRPFDGQTLLLRPRPEIHYRLPDGTRLQANRNVVLDDNGWTPFVKHLEIVEVPGDHDSMVLEPCVRVLAERVRSRLATSIQGNERLEAAQ